jgi:hypothetical protein
MMMMVASTKMSYYQEFGGTRLVEQAQVVLIVAQP